jgi:hypothetical protein
MRNLWGRCCRGTLVVALLCSAKVMVRVVGAQPTDFWGMWCRFVAGVVVGRRNSCAVVGMVAGEGFGYAVVEVVAGEGFDPTKLPIFLLMMKNVEGVL